jgi:hypothetical protein
MFETYKDLRKPGDQLVILGDGVVRAVGPSEAIRAQTRCDDLAEAYKHLTMVA